MNGISLLPLGGLKLPPLNQLAIAILLAISKLLAIRTLLIQQLLASQQSFAKSATLSDLAMPSNPATFSSPSTLSNADDIMLTSSSQSEELHANHSIPIASDNYEGSTTAVVAVMRGNPKDGYTRQCSNKHCKKNTVRVLLDSGSNGNLIFVNKDKSMLLP